MTLPPEREPEPTSVTGSAAAGCWIGSVAVIGACAVTVRVAGSASGGSGRTRVMPWSTASRSAGGGVASLNADRWCAVADSSAASARQSAQTARCCSNDSRSNSSRASTA